MNKGSRRGVPENVFGPQIKILNKYNAERSQFSTVNPEQWTRNGVMENTRSHTHMLKKRNDPASNLPNHIFGNISSDNYNRNNVVTPTLAINEQDNGGIPESHQVSKSIFVNAVRGVTTAGQPTNQETSYIGETTLHSVGLPNLVSSINTDVSHMRTGRVENDSIISEE